MSEIMETLEANDELDRIWRDKYPDARSLEEAVTRSRADGLDVDDLLAKAFAVDRVKQLIDETLAPLDALAEPSAVIGTTVQCNTGGPDHCVDVRAVNRDGRQMFT
jgi:hypothetical protein